MSSKKHLLNEGNENSKGQRPSRLSESQIRTINALRELGEKNRAKRIDLLKGSKVQPRKEKETKEPAVKPPRTRAKVKVPVIKISNAAKELLKGMKRAKTKEVVLGVEGKVEKGSFGAQVTKKGKRLKAKMHYSRTPAILRSPFLKNQGDLEYRRLIAQGKKRSKSDEEVEGITSDSERSEATNSTDEADNTGNTNSENNGNSASESSDTFAQGIEDLVTGMLEPKQFDLLGSGSIRLDNVAWHDFSEYIYTLNPYRSEQAMELIYIPLPGPAEIDVMPEDNTEGELSWEELGSGISNAIQELEEGGADSEGIGWIQRFNIELRKAFHDDIELSWTAGYPPTFCLNEAIYHYEQIADDILSVLFAPGMEDVLASLAELYGSIATPTARKSFLISLIHTFTSIKFH